MLISCSTSFSPVYSRARAIENLVGRVLGWRTQPVQRRMLRDLRHLSLYKEVGGRCPGKYDTIWVSRAHLPWLHVYYYYTHGVYTKYISPVCVYIYIYARACTRSCTRVLRWRFRREGIESDVKVTGGRRAEGSKRFVVFSFLVR